MERTGNWEEIGNQNMEEEIFFLYRVMCRIWVHIPLDTVLIEYAVAEKLNLDFLNSWLGKHLKDLS